MPVLSSELRNELGRVIIKAHRAAEAGARKALESLAVERHEPFSSMSLEERSLRRRLRARGRQLGDARDRTRGNQSIDRLAHEVAYEHWHRMLFARFLAENSLLIEPESGVAITMDECEELAREAGEEPRTLASRFAQGSLPQIFRTGDPVLDVTLAPETRQALDRLLDRLPGAVFTADDSLGWTYQYWQAEKKDAINKSGNKIGADELPAVTQLFTEHYMVLFLYHNTIGAWHAGQVMAANPSLAESAQSEEELRRAVRLRSQSGYDFEYLRFVREGKEGDEEDSPTGPWRPAAGAFEGWPKTAKELKVLDPCCGSGHFLIEGFELLVRLRMDEEGLGLEDAIRGVLADNLHGLEIDPRCTQIAAFNLAMAAWKLAGKPMELPALSIACSGLAVGSTKAEWMALAGDNERFRFGMERLYDLFEQAPELGSLIDPKALKGDMFEANFVELQPLLEQALERESDDVEGSERAVAAQGMVRSAELLAGEYTLTITNVPYLGRGQQSDPLKKLADEHYKEAKADLATIFVDRMLRWLRKSGTAAVVTPQNWTFLRTYAPLRKKFFANNRIDFLVELGAGSFSTPLYDFSFLLMMASSNSTRIRKTYSALVAGSGRGPEAKSTSLRENGVGRIEAEIVQKMEDCRFLTQEIGEGTALSESCSVHCGMQTGDNDRFVLKFWEVLDRGLTWEFFQRTPKTPIYFGGMEQILLWQNGQGPLGQQPGFRDNGSRSISEHLTQTDIGFVVHRMGLLPCAIAVGPLFDQNGAVLIPKRRTDAASIWLFLSSPDFSRSVRKFDNKVGVTPATLGKANITMSDWASLSLRDLPNGLPEPQSDDPTQWLFHGHPAKAEPATTLQVAVGRLLGYRWPPELDTKMRLADEAREWVARCDALKDFADHDGIVCLSATRGERSAADRLRDLLSAAFGSEWSNARERELLAAASEGNRPADSLETWLRDRFFEEHCKLFHHRPFVWHIWDGNRDGFHCLVNAHTITGEDGEGRRILEAITYAYLGDWIDRQRADQQEGKEGSDARLAAAQNLQGQLRKILEGEPPYDLFVRWKPLHEQAIGWEPDINDGVRLNIRPFLNAELRTGGKKGAGILRWKPNINWKKDRGKEPQSLRPRSDFPWFWGYEGEGSADERSDFAGGREFDGNRWNDLHYSSDCKRAPRALKE